MKKGSGWKYYSRLAFLGGVFFLAAVIAWFSADLCGVLTSYSFASTQDKTRWIDWNRAVYILSAVVIYSVFFIFAWRNRGNHGDYAERKHKRPEQFKFSAVIMLILTAVPISICALLNPSISGHVISPHLVFIIVPVVLSIILYFLISSNNRRGVLEW